MAEGLDKPMDYGAAHAVPLRRNDLSQQVAEMSQVLQEPLREGEFAALCQDIRAAEMASLRLEMEKSEWKAAHSRPSI